MMCRRLRSAAPSGRRMDRGSASIWVLACSALVLLLGMAASLRAMAVLARHRAESAADFAALAAAGRIGIGADGCVVARSIATANRAQLVRCQTTLAADGRSGTVEVAVRLSVQLPGLAVQQITATARAGRLAVSARLPVSGGQGDVAP